MSLSKFSDWKNPENLSPKIPKGFQAWVRWIYDLEEAKVLTKEGIKHFLTKQYGSTEDILKLSWKQIQEIEHPVGGKVMSLSKFSDWKNPENLSPKIPKGFQAWVRWMYDENGNELKKKD